MGRRHRRKRSKVAGEFPYVWDSDYRPAKRRGQRCRIISRSGCPGGLVRIQFEDGEPFVVAEGNLKRWRDAGVGERVHP